MVVTSTVMSVWLLLGYVTDVTCHSHCGVCPVVLCDSPAGPSRQLHTSPFNVTGEETKAIRMRYIMEMEMQLNTGCGITLVAFPLARNRLSRGGEPQ
ncbi:unnamed protein product [Lota lota]